MTVRLPDALAARSLFVVGKGGVGKTTTAAAIALLTARQELSTHLISIDPAHSLADVLEQTVQTGGAVSPCHPLLMVEEFDAAAYARRWLDELRPVLAGLIELGTYLDATDAHDLLQLSLPGVDEVMAAFRILEIADTGCDRIVVDCAPTGHLLRLLEVPALLASWADALGAVQAKADAVALGLVRQVPPSAARLTLANWRNQSHSFKELLRSSDWLVVTRSHPVVGAETERLQAALQGHALRLSAVLANGTAAPGAGWQAPWLPEPATGCNRLAEWINSVTPITQPAIRLAARGFVPAQLQQAALGFRQPLLLVAGKGGVGKTTVACALALANSEDGVCLLSTDPAGSLSDVLEQPVGPDAVAVGTGVRARQVDADARYGRLRATYAERVKEVFERLGLDRSVDLDRAVVDRLWNLAPSGLDEIVGLTELMAEDAACSQTILDTAPTGHFLRLLQMPELATDWAHTILRVLLRYRLASSLEGFTRDVLDFARRTRQLSARLTSPAEAGVVLVTNDEPVVWRETERLHAAVVGANIPVAALIVNRADAGPLRGHPFLKTIPRVIRAPNVAEAPTGPAALRSFLTHWEIVK